MNITRIKPRELSNKFKPIEKKSKYSAISLSIKVIRNRKSLKEGSVSTSISKLSKTNKNNKKLRIVKHHIDYQRE